MRVNRLRFDGYMGVSLTSTLRTKDPRESRPRSLSPTDVEKSSYKVIVKCIEETRNQNDENFYSFYGLVIQ